MSQFITAEVCVGAMGLVALLLVGTNQALTLKKLFGRRPDQEPILRGEYDRDELSRKEQIARVEGRCTSVEALATARWESVMKGIVELKVEVAKLTIHLPNPCTGVPPCPTPNLPPPPALSSPPPRAPSRPS